MDDLLLSYESCRDGRELAAFAGSPGAASAKFQQELFQQRERLRAAGVPAAVREAAERRFEAYFRILATRLIGMADADRDMRLSSTPPRDRRDARLVIDQQWRERDAVFAASGRADIRRGVARLVANIVDVAGPAGHGLRIADRIAGSLTADDFREALRLVEGAPPEAAELIEQLSRRVLAPQWNALPVLGESIASLRFADCAACGARYAFDFWNVIGEDDPARRAAFAGDTLNVATCPHCGSDAARQSGWAMFGGVPLEHELTRRMTCCPADFGFVVRVPDAFAAWSDETRVFQAMAEILFALKPHPLPHLALVIAFSADEVRRGLAASSDDSPREDAFAQFTRFAYPLVLSIRQGIMTFEQAEVIVAARVGADPAFGPGGVLGSREFEVTDPDTVFLIALIARANEDSGHREAAAMGFLEAAAQAQLTGRAGAVPLFLDRADALLDDPVISEEMRLGARGQLHLIRATELANTGGENAEQEFRRAIEGNRRRLDLRRDLDSSPSVLNLTSALVALAGIVSHRDFREADQALRESLDLFARAEQEWSRDDLDEHVFSSLRSARTLAMARRAELYGHCRTFIHAAAWIFDAPATPKQRTAGQRMLMARGIDQELLQSNFQFMVDEFPEFVRVDPATKTVGFRAGLFDEIAARQRKAYAEAYELAVRDGGVRIASFHATQLASAHAAAGNRQEAFRYAALAVEHARASGEPLALAGALTLHAQFFLADDPGEALARLREAYVLYMSVRRSLVDDVHRVSFGRATSTISRLIGAALRDAPAMEWISVLETIKAGALSDAFVRPPLRLTDLPEDALQRLRQLEDTIAALRAQLTADGTTAAHVFPLRGAIELYSGQRDEVRNALIAGHPRYSEALADAPSMFADAAVLIDATGRRFGDAAAMVGMWLDGEDLLVFGRGPLLAPFRARVPLLDSLRRESGGEVASVAGFAEAFRSALFRIGEHPEEERDFRARFAGPLYRALWHGLARELDGASEVVVSPHVALQSIPWATLWDGEHYLAESIAFTTVFTFNLSPDAGRPSDAAPRLLILADPDGDGPPLPGARLEAQMIASVADENQVEHMELLGSEATRDNLWREARRSDVVHFACHAEFDAANPARSSLVLSEERVRMQQIADELELPGRSLVTLSGCDTGRGAIAPGDEVLGLTRSFSFAGARDVVASLWRVRDDAAALLMATFYSHYLRADGGYSPRQALALAQCDMLHAAGFSSNPAAWGAFVHYGV